MSELSQVVRLVRIARRREEAGDLTGAETAWKAASRANVEIPRDGSPLFEIRNPTPVASPQLDDLPPGWFFSEDEIPPTTRRLNDLNRLALDPSELEEYQPLSIGERTVGLLAGIFDLAAKKARETLVGMKLPPEVTTGNLFTTAANVVINGPGQEAHRVSPPTPEEQISADSKQIALAVLLGDYRPPEPETERDQARINAFQTSVEEHGVEYVLGVRSMFDFGSSS